MKNKIKMVFGLVVIGTVIISACIIDWTKIIWLICPVIAGCLCSYACNKGKIEYNTAVDLFLCSVIIVLFIYLRTILNYWRA